MADINIIMNKHAFIFHLSDSKLLMQLSQHHSFYTPVEDTKTSLCSDFYCQSSRSKAVTLYRYSEKVQVCRQQKVAK